jgi:hypothetical protein
MLKVTGRDLRQDDRGDIPEWIWSFAKYVQERWGIHERVTLTLRQGVDMGMDGQNIIHQDILLGEVELPLNMEEDREDGYNTILHEVLHTMDAEVLESHERVMDLVPEQYRDHVSKLLRTPYERLHDRRCIILTPIMRAEWEKSRRAALKSVDGKSTMPVKPTTLRRTK